MLIGRVLVMVLAFFAVSGQGVLPILSEEIGCSLDSMSSSKNGFMPVFKSSIVDVRSRARKGDAEAQLELSFRYFMGQGGVSQNADEGLKWFHRAAEHGCLAAQYLSCDALEEKVPGAEKWCKTAFNRIRQLAEKGEVLAQSVLAGMYDMGWGTSRDNKAAMKWYYLAAKAGEPSAQSIMGRAYRHGDCCLKEDRRGCCYSPGEVDYTRNFSREPYQNKFEAIRWYRLAAEQDHVGAQFALSEMLEESDPQALEWLRKSAEGGNADAQYGLGRAYTFGTRGLVSDVGEALKWYRLAAAKRLGEMPGNFKAKWILEGEIWKCMPSYGNRSSASVILTRMEKKAESNGELFVGDVVTSAYFRLDGLNRRWNWFSGKGRSYAVIIKFDGIGLYYDFSGVPDGESTKAEAVLGCVKLHG